ncbi:MAG TPA: tRNA (adenosine(37)-N6)-threonylcarbamoyltransferase complex ATPase subunit type 1 TsaE [Thermoanaerobaculia bacterium]|nr:tRNA (adenosine(37)-N6)-threonylcarbamoyltransferase complex ATPase subunit type 1 TsaE [Thermoanaerobaculia bacterium]
MVTHSEAETREHGRALARELAPDGVLLLSGELGSGKTVLARGIGEGLGIDAREVQSPTFTIIREHEGSGGRLVHVDLYRLGPEETAGLGLDELLAGPGVKVVEWAERLPFAVPGARWLRLRRLAQEGGEEREIAEDSNDDNEGF